MSLKKIISTTEQVKQFIPVQTENETINKGDIEITRDLGEGSNANVKLILLDCKEFALKIPKLPSDEFEYECELAVKLGEQEIGPISKRIHFDEKLCLLMEKVDPITKSKLNSLQLRQIFNIQKKLADLKLHDLDIKPDHFVVNKEGNVRLIDFGLRTDITGPKASKVFRDPMNGNASYTFQQLLSKVFSSSGDLSEEEILKIRATEMVGVLVCVLGMLFPRVEKNKEWTLINDVFDFNLTDGGETNSFMTVYSLMQLVGKITDLKKEEVEEKLKTCHKKLEQFKGTEAYYAEFDSDLPTFTSTILRNIYTTIHLSNTEVSKLSDHLDGLPSILIDILSGRDSGHPPSPNPLNA